MESFPNKKFEDLVTDDMKISVCRNESVTVLIKPFCVYNFRWFVIYFLFIY